MDQQNPAADSKAHEHPPMEKPHSEGTHGHEPGHHPHKKMKMDGTHPHGHVSSHAKESRKKLPQVTESIWQHIDDEIYKEFKRVSIGPKIFSNKFVKDSATTYNSNLITLEEQRFIVDESVTRPIIQVAGQFEVTASQLQNEQKWGTIRTLALMVTNQLTLAMDAILLEGPDALTNFTPLRSGLIRTNVRTLPDGLWQFGANQIIEVPHTEIRNGVPIYAENLYTAIADGYQRLASGAVSNHAIPPPYAFVSNFSIKASANTPLATTMILPESAINAIMDDFIGTASLGTSRAVMVSKSGQNIELVIGCTPSLEFVTQDGTNGNFVFSVFIRFALFNNLVNNVIRFDFQ